MRIIFNHIISIYSYICKNKLYFLENYQKRQKRLKKDYSQYKCDDIITEMLRINSDKIRRKESEMICKQM